jgi:serine/threonine protein kinase/WD40 repeat protein
MRLLASMGLLDWWTVGMRTPTELFQGLCLLQIIDPTKLLNLEEYVRSTDTLEGATQRWVASGIITPFQLQAIRNGKHERLLVGPYLLVARLGTGGMGQVFVARHRELGREVALKVIRKDHFESPLAVSRFLRELRLTASIDHPNVVRVYNAGQGPNQMYFSMEYVRGLDLNAIVRQGGPMSIADACRAIADAASGLQAIHVAGVVHRDLKPSNLVRSLVGGSTKVLDLGLSGLRQQRVSDSMAGTLTQNGIILGTPDFMPPEQALDPHGVDHRADLYALGATLYFLLVGQSPFPKGSPVEKLFQHAYESPPWLCDKRPDVPEELSQLVRDLLQKNLQDRPATATELLERLQRFTQIPSTVALPNPFELPDEEPFESLEGVADFPPVTGDATTTLPSRTGRWVRWLVATVLALGAGVLGYALLRPTAPKAVVVPPMPLTLEDRFQQLARQTRAPNSDPTALRSELYQLYSENRGTNFGVPTARLLRQLPPVSNERAIGTQLDPAFLHHGPMDGRHWGAILGLTVRGNRIATASFDRTVKLWDADTGKCQQTLDGFEDPIFSVDVSPDGLQVAAASQLLSSQESEGFERAARVWNCTGGPAISRLANSLDWIVSWKYSHSGKIALCGSYDRLHLRQVSDGKILKTFASAKGNTNWVIHAVFDREDRFAIASCNDYQIRVWDLTTAEELRVWRYGNWFASDFAISPDGNRVATMCENQLKVWDWRTGKLLAERNFDAVCQAVAFAPDGYFVGFSNGTVVAIDEQLKTRSETTTPHFGPINRLIYDFPGNRLITAGADGTLRRWRATASGLTEIDPVAVVSLVSSLEFAEQDRQLTIVRENGQIETWNTETGVVKVLAGTATKSRWVPSSISGDGNSVATVTEPQRLRVWSAGSAIRELRIPDGAVAGLNWLPNRHQVLIAYHSPQPSLQLFDLENARTVQTLDAATGRLDGTLAVSLDGRWAAMPLPDSGEAAIWNLSSGKLQEKVNRPYASALLRGLSFSPTFEALHLYGRGWGHHVWPLKNTNSERTVWNLDANKVVAGAISPDAKIHAIATADGGLFLLNESGRTIRSWPSVGRLNRLVFSRNSRYLATAATDGGVRVFRIE